MDLPHWLFHQFFMSSRVDQLCFLFEVDKFSPSRSAILNGKECILYSMLLVVRIVHNNLAKMLV